MLNTIMILLSAFSLAGCASTFPIQGRYKNPSNPFDGNVTFNSTTKTGTLAFTTLSGITCSGQYVVTTKIKSQGEFKCDNGELGTFTVSAGAGDGRGHGFGKSNDGETFVFRFGQSMKGNCADCHNASSPLVGVDNSQQRKGAVLDRLF